MNIFEDEDVDRKVLRAAIQIARYGYETRNELELRVLCALAKKEWLTEENIVDEFLRYMSKEHPEIEPSEIRCMNPVYALAMDEVTRRLNVRDLPPEVVAQISKISYGDYTPREIADKVAHVNLIEPNRSRSSVLSDITDEVFGSSRANRAPQGNLTQRSEEQGIPWVGIIIGIVALVIFIPLFQSVLFPMIAALIWYGVPVAAVCWVIFWCISKFSN